MATEMNNINIYMPENINYIINFLEQNKYITISKVSVDWWSFVFEYMRKNNINFNELSNSDFKNMAKQANEKGYINMLTGKFFYVNEYSFSIPYEFIKNQPKDFILGISHMTPGKRCEFIKNKLYKKDHLLKIKIIKNLNSIIKQPLNVLDAFVWKVWGYEDQLNLLYDYCNQNNIKIKIIGPSVGNYLFDLCKNINALFFEIDANAAIKYIDSYVDEIKKTHISNTMYLIVGGSAGMVLSYKLHNELLNKYIFDVGLAVARRYKY